MKHILNSKLKQFLITLLIMVSTAFLGIHDLDATPINQQLLSSLQTTQNITIPIETVLETDEGPLKGTYTMNLSLWKNYHLPSSRNGDGLPILRQYQTFTQESSRIYPLWIIDGQQFNSPPIDVLALSPLIRKVRILVNAAETNRWGKQARAGVIVLETAR